MRFLRVAEPMKMTKKLKERLEGCLNNMEETKAFILKDNIRFDVKYSGGWTLGINKQIGSKLCYLYNAIDELKLILRGVEA